MEENMENSISNSNGNKHKSNHTKSKQGVSYPLSVLQFGQ